MRKLAFLAFFLLAAGCVSEQQESNKEMHFGLRESSDFKLVEELGPDLMEGEIVWMLVEPEKGKINFTAADLEIWGAQDAGIGMVYNLMPVSDWGSDNLTKSKLNASRRMLHYFDTGTPEQMDAWLEFVNKAVERYDGDGNEDMPGLKTAVKHWQVVGNWLNNWHESDDAFFEFYARTVAAIRNADPDAEIISPAIVEAKYLAAAAGYVHGETDVWGDVKRNESSVLILPARESAEGIANDSEYVEKLGRVRMLLKNCGYFDIVDVHLYDTHEVMDEVMDWAKNETLAQCGMEKQIWMLKAGGPFFDYDGKKHAEEVVKMQAIAFARGVDAFFWSSVSPSTEHVMEHVNFNLMGLADSDGSEKPAFHAYKFFAAKVGGFSSAHEITIANVEGAIFEVNGKDIAVVWSENGKQEVDLREIYPNATRFGITELPLEDGAGEERIANSSLLNVSSMPIFVGQK